ncbi:Alpha-glucanase [Colletotrichum higginsianum IMI 349063]|uniref:Alpha-glucanase n=1 Tax=Colletotrichum higginsianum (strain IMI 349063) TaxID=759273 RepID=A0A1B7Y4C5_COLHI|nr:Alpha-glucanase [Colletotrichum higginsianum IMI 349063]OBR06891.1 Alpha-glucanase [Colletotrichum higginsianum IMI 349063]
MDVIVGGIRSLESPPMRPEGKIGIFHGSASIKGRAGPVKIEIRRGRKVVAELHGQRDCWNADRTIDGKVGTMALMGQSDHTDLSPSEWVRLASHIIAFVDCCPSPALPGRVAHQALLIGEAGKVVFTVYDIIKDPAPAPYAILAMLVVPMGLPFKGERTAFGQIEDTLTALKEGDLKLLVVNFVEKDSKAQNLNSNTL